MDIRNDTPFAHGIALGMGVDRQPCLAIMVKATFEIPATLDGPVAVAEEQLGILDAEDYYQGDITGSLRFDADAVPFKPRTDVVLVGSVHAPRQRPAEHVDVLLQVGPVSKALRVFGERHWLFPSKAFMVPIISKPQPFVEMPLVYERAFGGFDRKAGKWCDRNYVGVGFLGRKTRASVDGKPLPNIEDPAHLITSWNDEPMPAGFGFYSPACQPRTGYSGTEKGAEQRHPLFGLASDFDHAYYNGAHPDLQVPGYLRGDEEVDLINLTKDGRRRFRLPGIQPVISVAVSEATPAMAPRENQEHEGDPPEDTLPAMAVSEPGPTILDAPLDTLVLLPEEGLFYQVWRSVWPLSSDLEASLQAISEVCVLDRRVGAEEDRRTGE